MIPSHRFYPLAFIKYFSSNYPPVKVFPPGQAGERDLGCAKTNRNAIFKKVSIYLSKKFRRTYFEWPFLALALKYEGIDLYVLKAVFNAVSNLVVKKIIEAEPTGQYSRRIWFLYEWLMDIRLDIPCLKTGNYIDVLEDYSRPRLELIEWKPTRDNNVEVLNETIDLYRYFDAT